MIVRDPGRKQTDACEHFGLVKKLDPNADYWKPVVPPGNAGPFRVR